MKRTIIIYFLLTSNFLTFGQKDIFIDEPFFGLPMREASVKEIDSLRPLPTKIQNTIKQLFDSSLTDFTTNIKFVRGQIIDLDNFATKNPSFQLQYEYVIPKYELYFEVKDTSIGIKSYCFELSLDQYGQIIRFGWPREGFNKRKNFEKPISFKNEACKYALNKKYKTTSPIYDMYFNETTNTLQWHVSFLQKSTGNERSSYKVYKAIIFDANSKTVLREHEWSLTSNSD